MANNVKENSITITISKEIIEKAGGLVILTLKKYEKLRNRKVFPKGIKKGRVQNINKKL